MGDYDNDYHGDDYHEDYDWYYFGANSYYANDAFYISYDRCNINDFGTILSSYNATKTPYFLISYHYYSHGIDD